MGNKSIKIWLSICLIFLLSMVFIGGFTRLSRAGLSITEWNFITGSIPPLNQKNWINEFAKYQKIPEFKTINHEMGLNEFKKIYLIEYFHRLLARITALILFLPLILFFLFKKIDNKFFFKNLFIFSLIIVQGTIGWLMVKSGLKNRVSVNEFMLGFHLVFALLIFSLVSFEFFKLQKKDNRILNNSEKKTLQMNFFFIKFLCFFGIPLQIFFGGLVAGLHVNGFCFQNSHELCTHNPLKFIGFENFFIMQNLFIHRNFAIFIFFLILFVIFNNFRKKFAIFENILIILIICFQMILGIFALSIGNKNLNIFFASIHQLNAFFLMFVILKIFYKYKNLFNIK